jgi:hypothetical protein
LRHVSAAQFDLLKGRLYENGFRSPELRRGKLNLTSLRELGLGQSYYIFRVDDRSISLNNISETTANPCF